MSKADEMFKKLGYEKEIIEECKRIIFEWGYIRESVDGKIEDLQALKGLLDLYQKEKEKNKNIDEFCRKELAFERRLKRENREPDEKEIIETLENLAVDKYIDERKLEEKDVEAIINIIVLYRQEKEKNIKTRLGGNYE